MYLLPTACRGRGHWSICICIPIQESMSYIVQFHLCNLWLINLTHILDVNRVPHVPVKKGIRKLGRTFRNVCNVGMLFISYQLLSHGYSMHILLDGVVVKLANRVPHVPVKDIGKLSSGARLLGMCVIFLMWACSSFLISHCRMVIQYTFC